MVVDPNGLGVATVWAAFDICPDIQHRAVHLHVVLMVCTQAIRFSSILFV